MAITQRLLNLDSYFRSTPGDKIIVNDLDYLNVNDVEKINNSLITVYNNTDVISTKPSCDCGNLTGRYLVGKYCSKCGTPCTEVNDKVYPIIWLRALHPSIKFMSPTFYNILSMLISKDTNYFRWLGDEKFKLPVNKIPTHIQTIKETILENKRSYLNLIENIPKILEYLKVTKYKVTDEFSQTNIDYALYLWEKEQHNIFTEYLPIVNKKLFVKENTSKGVFVQFVAANAMDIVMNWLKVSSNPEEAYTLDSDGNQILMANVIKKWESATMATVDGLSKMYVKYIEDYVAQKPGIFRKHVYGARSHFTFRNVITSVPGKHRHDEIFVPWCIGTSVFRPHLLNKLVNKHGFSNKYANKILYRAAKKYDPLIDQLLTELIEESPKKGLPVIIQRNPSLKRGSALKMLIKGFHKDPGNNCINISYLAIKLANGDYDGDEMNTTAMLDNTLDIESDEFQPYKTTFDMDKTYSVSRFVSMQTPANIILGNYLDDKSVSSKKDTIVGKLKFVDV